MIVVTVELWPGGNQEAAVDLGKALLVNDLQESLASNLELGDYEVRILKGKLYSTSGGVWKKGTVHGFPRRSRSVGPWELLYLALEACGIDKRAARVESR